MGGFKAIIDIISNLKKINFMKRNNKSTAKKKIILMSVQTVLEVAGLGITFRKGELSTFGLLVPSHQKILKSK